jgi:hypothetical protein
LAQECGHIIAGLERPKPWNCAGIGKIPLVFGNADEITNGWVTGPGPAQRRLGQLGRHAGAQKSANVAARRDGVD